MTGDLFDQAALRDHFMRSLPAHNPVLEYHPSLASTNARCMQLSRHGSIVISEHQTEGRGRRGRRWHSPAGRNLYASLGIDVQLPAEKLGLVSLLVGTCIAESLTDEGYQGVELKWPNDILMDERKLGGILIEAKPGHSGQFYLVVGLGINLYFDAQDFEQIDQPAAALREFSQDPFRPQALVGRLLTRVFDGVAGFRSAASAELLQRFSYFDYLRGKPVSVTTADKEIVGDYVGPADDGQLRVNTSNGERRFMAADISLREQKPCC